MSKNYDRRFTGSVYQHSQWEGSSAVDRTTTTQRRIGDYVFSTGSKTPGWRKKLRQGVDIVTPYSITIETGESVQGSLTLSSYNKDSHGVKTTLAYSETTSGDLALSEGFYPNTSDVSQIASQASSAVSSKFANAANQKMMEGGVFLGEIRETIRMLRHPLEGARRLSDLHFNKSWKLAKRVRFSAERFLKSYTDLYLEFNFGLAPLLHDIQDAAKALDAIRGRNATNVVRVSASKSSGTAPSTYQTAFQTCIVTVNITYTSKARAGAGCRIDFTNSAPNPSAVKALGITPGNFIPTVWELIPYSFLIDYFVNVGDILNSTFNVVTNAKFGYTTIKTTAESLKIVGGVDLAAVQAAHPSYYQVAGGHGGLFKHQKVVFTRSVGIPTIPNLVFSSPAIDSQRWDNIGALIVNKFLSLSRRLK